MSKNRTIDSFYKPKKDDVHDPETETQTQTNEANITEGSLGDRVEPSVEPSAQPRVEPVTNTTLNSDGVRLDSLIRDPGVRPPFSSYPSNQQDEIRRTYVRLGPYQLVKAHYPLSPCGFHKRSFQAAWFKRFWWLEYSDKKDAVFSLSHLKLDVQDIRGQGYDGASNMRGEWNGLKALILNECPFAYYVHCFAHQLQLALVAASKDVSEVHTFFKHLNFIVNVIGSSTKRNDQLQDAQLAEISHLAEIGELKTGRGANQMQNLQRPGDTRWSSHFKSICSLLKLFGPTRVVLNDICLGRATSSQKGDAKYALTHLLSFDFILVMHLMKKIMEITDKLCKFLQNKSQDIVNALTLVSTTKTLIQKLRDNGWQSLLDQVVCFCEKYSIPVPDMSATYRDIIQSRSKKNDVTVEHHYRVDVFIVAIDSQLQELNNRFSESVSELLRLSVTLDPSKSFNAEDISKLVTKYYPLDFTEQERIGFKLELQHFELDSDSELKNVSSLSALCRGLQKTKKLEMYPLIDRLVRLILTLPVSTATSERAFSKMKLVKTRLRSTMSDDFLKSSMILSIEREIVGTLCNEKIIDDFYCKSQRRVQMMMKKRKVTND